MFAAIVGRALKSICLWRLQEGEYIGLLDALLGSTTFTNTITTQVSLRSLHFVGVLLVLLWALSPIGGQASLRVLSFEPHPITNSATLQYMDTNSSYEAYMAADTGSQLSPVDALFLSALAAPPTTKASSSDTWGNLKIPMLETIPGYSEKRAQTWLSVDAGNTNSTLTYSSLLGVPIANIPSRGNTTFNLETSYWVLNCSPLEPVDSYADMNNLLNNTGSTVPDWVASWGGINSTTLEVTPSGEFRCNAIDPQMPPRTIQYVSYDSYLGFGSNPGTKATCTVRTSYVELSVSCRGWDCNVGKIRQSTLPHQPTWYTGLDNCNGYGPTPAFSWYAAYFARIIAGVHGAEPTALQLYFINPANPFNISAIYSMPPLYSVGSQSFAISLAQLLNTYWIASVGTEALVLGHPANFTALSFLALKATRFLHTTATITVNEEVMVCHWGWLIALLIATFAMFLAAVAKLVIDLQIWIPTLSMNISTIARNNPCFTLPHSGSALSDSKRSRLLRDMKARFGDVAPGDQVGYLMAGDCYEDGGHVLRFQKNRYYR
ncbi:hypothetical protein FGG08_005299 [Glutinoglossum americanum]|uniref:Uncharacterized protein n=1 Tax=Glutinoglossum americanum TaxID=1670608 RepID=A0A9P8I3A2_9PEZI|nr:hypothetical protein FGG08_005299 [Glutinoglossum americanum]